MSVCKHRVFSIVIFAFFNAAMAYKNFIMFICCFSNSGGRSFLHPLVFLNVPCIPVEEVFCCWQGFQADFRIFWPIFDHALYLMLRP